MGCVPSIRAPELTLDFEGAKPTDEESKVYKDVEEALKDSKSVLQHIVDYEGCQALVRTAMKDPSRENEQAAFEGLLKAVDNIHMFFTFARDFERVLPQLYGLLAPARPRDDGRHPLLVYQACGRQLATLLDFIIQFDQTRMMRPNLSNDFSYYRRLLPKFSRHQDVKVKDDEASGMALFTAEHMPMMFTLVKATKAYADSENCHESVSNLYSTLANTCMRLAKAKRFKTDNNLLCLRAMTGSIVIYDHLEQKAFSKRSQISIRDCILVLQRDYDRKDTEGLLNAIRYSTPSFRAAPLSIQSLFE